MSPTPQEQIVKRCSEFRLPTVAAEVVPRFQASDHEAALGTLLEVLELEASACPPPGRSYTGPCRRTALKGQDPLTAPERSPRPLPIHRDCSTACVCLPDPARS